MFEGPIQELIDELARLPGIGPKSAQRLAFWLVKAPPDDAKRLASAITRAKDRISFCRECGSVAEGEFCRICRDPCESEHPCNNLDNKENERQSQHSSPPWWRIFSAALSR